MSALVSSREGNSVCNAAGRSCSAAHGATIANDKKAAAISALILPYFRMCVRARVRPSPRRDQHGTFVDMESPSMRGRRDARQCGHFCEGRYLYEFRNLELGTESWREIFPAGRANNFGPPYRATRFYLSKVSAQSAGEVISAAGLRSASAGPRLPRRARAARN